MPEPFTSQIAPCACSMALAFSETCNPCRPSAVSALASTFMPLMLRAPLDLRSTFDLPSADKDVVEILIPEDVSSIEDAPTLSTNFVSACRVMVLAVTFSSFSISDVLSFAVILMESETLVTKSFLTSSLHVSPMVEVSFFLMSRVASLLTARL